MDSAPSQFFPPHHQLGLFRSPAWQQAWRAHWSDIKALKPLRSTNDEQPEFYRYWQVKRGLPMRTVIPAGISTRSEERRVGKECRQRGGRDQEETKRGRIHAGADDSELWDERGDAASMRYGAE